MWSVLLSGSEEARLFLRPPRHSDRGQARRTQARPAHGRARPVHPQFLYTATRSGETVRLFPDTPGSERRDTLRRAAFAAASCRQEEDDVGAVGCGALFPKAKATGGYQ